MQPARSLLINSLILGNLFIFQPRNNQFASTAQSAGTPDRARPLLRQLEIDLSLLGLAGSSLAHPVADLSEEGSVAWIA